MVALTFDDGPAQRTTDKVLDILSEYRARATFFVVGQHVEARPDVARRIARSGHQIGNHSFRHRPVRSVDHVKQCDAVLGRLGIKSRFFRPPGGVLPLTTFLRLSLAGYTVAFWSFDSRDSMRLEGKVPDVLPDYQSVESGDIVLMHDDNDRCVAELPELLRILETKGVRPVTLSTLLALGEPRS